MNNIKYTFIPVISCLSLMLLGLLSQAISPYLSLAFYLGAILFGGFKQTQEGLIELWEEHTLNVDLLMALAAIGACLIGEFFEGAMLTFIFCLSGALEEYTTSKSQQEITALMNLQPHKAQRLTEKEELEEIAVEELTIHDRVFVSKGATIPIDGFLESSQAVVDEATISGESIPVEKKQQDELFAGTINQGNPFILRVTKKSTDTVFAKIIKLVEEAQNTPTKTASFISRIENTYVKCVLLFVPLMVLFSSFFFGWSLQESFYRGMVLLVVASPCALVASATPATLAALSNAARNGVLIKGGFHLEQFAQLRSIAFDKTGTLTQGKPVVTDSYFVTDDVLISQQILVSMEEKTTHPLAQAIVAHFDCQIPKEIQQLSIEEMTGFGLRTTYQGNEWGVGKWLPEKRKIQDQEIKRQIALLEQQGKTVIALTRDDELMAVLGLLDVPKDNAKQVIDYFNAQNISTSMITGDNKGTAQVIAKQIGIHNLFADCTPAKKTKYAQQQKETYEVTAMVGDGVNDAPALATASLGIAMGQGTDVAMEIADIVLVKNDLHQLTYTHRLSLKMKKIIKQNILFSLTMICLLILSNFLQFLNLPLGVVGHEGSTILVILNGLRLLKPLPVPKQKEPPCASCPLQSTELSS
ncbi:heavy metal translocating P-type ATPase [Enterococcus villorum]|uniref:ATPase n=2 Tax=Enterococcus villorum TaxID=112904 RepID=A0A511IYT1_9ENTE|nr:heavy metal translocating P-type ATPase [Enterococcus villorum ATCC 700913]EOW78173.1 cadmium-translocating P-type ATPase [Enterococcus villorum ATCC 700913]GEL90885.1 ATPase [Enterococcus villorum]